MTVVVLILGSELTQLGMNREVQTSGDTILILSWETEEDDASHARFEEEMPCSSLHSLKALETKSQIPLEYCDGPRRRVARMDHSCRPSGTPTCFLAHGRLYVALALLGGE